MPQLRRMANGALGKAQRLSSEAFALPQTGGETRPTKQEGRRSGRPSPLLSQAVWLEHPDSDGLAALRGGEAAVVTHFAGRRTA